MISLPARCQEVQTANQTRDGFTPNTQTWTNLPKPGRFRVPLLHRTTVLERERGGRHQPSLNQARAGSKPNPTQVESFTLALRLSEGTMDDLNRPGSVCR